MCAEQCAIILSRSNFLSSLPPPLFFLAVRACVVCRVRREEAITAAALLPHDFPNPAPGFRAVKLARSRGGLSLSGGGCRSLPPPGYDLVVLCRGVVKTSVPGAPSAPSARRALSRKLTVRATLGSGLPREPLPPRE